LFGAGITQVYLERIMGMDFNYVKTNFTNFWLLWRLVAGVAFTIGTIILVNDFLHLGINRSAVNRRDINAGL